jgi:hypothetical protein
MVWITQLDDFLGKAQAVLSYLFYLSLLVAVGESQSCDPLLKRRPQTSLYEFARLDYALSILILPVCTGRKRLHSSYFTRESRTSISYPSRLYGIYFVGSACSH